MEFCSLDSTHFLEPGGDNPQGIARLTDVLSVDSTNPGAEALGKKENHLGIYEKTQKFQCFKKYALVCVPEPGCRNWIPSRRFSKRELRNPNHPHRVPGATQRFN